MDMKRIGWISLGLTLIVLTGFVIYFYSQYQQYKHAEQSIHTMQMKTASAEIGRALDTGTALLNRWDDLSDKTKLYFLSKIRSDLDVSVKALRLSDTHFNLEERKRSKSIYFVYRLIDNYSYAVEELEMKLVRNEENQEQMKQEVEQLVRDLVIIRERFSGEKVKDMNHDQLKELWTRIVKQLTYREALERYNPF
ncbi:MAG: hypothetical protein H0Z32_15015 [Bacillaceae bacterium]|nr:hypothetical protein [Bacillaceae bacterium]